MSSQAGYRRERKEKDWPRRINDKLIYQLFFLMLMNSKSSRRFNLPNVSLPLSLGQGARESGPFDKLKAAPWASLAASQDRQLEDVTVLATHSTDSVWRNIWARLIHNEILNR